MTLFRRADRFFLAAALSFGAVFVAVTAPFGVPDEPAHFYRAYAVSEGTLTAQKLRNRTGAVLPTRLGDLVDAFGKGLAYSERGLEPAAMDKARRLELEPDVRSFIDFPNTAVSPPLPYLPQGLAIAAGRMAGASPLELFYFARLGNLLAATILIYLGLRRLPAYRWLGAAIALTPMATFLRSSVSADALTFAIGFLFAATVARLAFGTREPIRWRDVALLCLLAAALCLSKAVYLPLVLTAAVIPARRLPRRRRGAAILAYVLATAGALALTVGSARSKTYVVTPRAVEAPFMEDAVVDSKGQIRETLRQPLRFLRIAGSVYLRHGPRYAAEFVGRLGWLDVPLPRLVLAAYAVLLLALTVADTRREIHVAPWQRGLLFTAALGTLWLIAAVLFALFMPVGSTYISGIQGRYFLPIAPVAVWAFHTRRWAGKTGRAGPPWLGPVTALVCTLSLGVSLAVLIGHYKL